MNKNCNHKNRCTKNVMISDITIYTTETNNETFSKVTKLLQDDSELSVLQVLHTLLHKNML